MIVIGAGEVRALLSMRDAIEIVEAAMIAVADGKANMPLRNVMEVGGVNRLGIMPGALSGDAPTYGVKLISLFPGNPARGLSSHIGAMVMFDPETGAPAAVIDADALTAIRTAAASAAATRALAREDARVLALIGTGEQAEAHLAAIPLVRDIAEVRVTGRTPDRAAAFCDRMRADYPHLPLHPAASVAEAVRGADIVCTLTASPEVVLLGRNITPGTHVNAVGASIPTMQEIDAELVLKSRLFVDYLASALAQAREIMDALASGAMADGHILGEIGALYAGRIKGRLAAGDITLYRSLGVAAQDLACAAAIIDRQRT
ncbi:MAG: ornithine cyclodeaminase family protein [Rhodobacteraceae bacterium]|nr:ornithine cyclodeaminase family protein [Paracoccaceae bacterium]